MDKLGTLYVLLRELIVAREITILYEIECFL